MLSRRTVFVLGAGASQELNLPTGEDLKSAIVTELRTDPSVPPTPFVNESVYHAVRSYVAEAGHAREHTVYQEFLDAAQIISQALPFALSIDQYLDAHRDNPYITKLGKLGIAAAILSAERESSMGDPRSRPRPSKESAFTHRPPNTWHLRLVQLLTSGHTRETVSAIFDNVAFIVFNYDRCLEHYLAVALNRYYGSSFELQQALRSLTIVHPYGQVGLLPWQGSPSIRFGGEDKQQLREVAEGLFTFTESARVGVTDEVRELLTGARTVVFLGFGFLPQNVELLRCNERSAAKRAFFTACGISESDAQFVRDDVYKILRKEHPVGNVRIDSMNTVSQYQENGTCLDLMKNHWMRLTRMRDH